MNDNTINADVTMGGATGTLLAGRYRVVRQLGQGGMGSVWLAEDTTLDNRQVAIKMLPSVLLSNKRAYQQIKSEALLSLKLLHSNIAPIRSFEENGGNPFLVEDYIHGKNLDDCLAEWGTLADEEVISLLKPVAEALDYAHREKIVHRDIKPANIMVREDGVPFVLDFGIAREVQETMTCVTGKLSSGTLMYMSPEQLKGVAPSPEQDVYSFAAMVYECLCGHPPFCRGQIEYQIVNEQPEPLPHATPLARMVMRALSKNPAERPMTCVGILQGDRTAKATSECRAAEIPNANAKRGGGGLIKFGLLVAAVFIGGIAYFAMSGRHPSDASSEHGGNVVQEPILRPIVSSATQKEAEAPVVEMADVDAKSNEASERKPGGTFAVSLDGHILTKESEADAPGPTRSARPGVERLKQDTTGTVETSGKTGTAETNSEKNAIAAFERGDYTTGWRLVSNIQDASPLIQFYVGMCYAKGRGGAPCDIEKALQLWQAAAKHGNAGAQYELGICHLHGNGVDVNPTEGMRWVRLAADQGYADAQTDVGLWYFWGENGIARDYAQAVKWWQLAAEQGNVEAQKMLGGCYCFGKGVASDRAKAMKWWRLAADQGCDEAKESLKKLVDGVDPNHMQIDLVPESVQDLGNMDATGDDGYGQIEEENKFECFHTQCVDVDFAPVYFGGNSANIPPGELGKIDAVIQHLERNANRVVVLTGNCDERSSTEYALSIGEMYVSVVRRHLIENGISADRIQTHSYGAERPACLGDDEVARARNRRVEFALFSK